MVIEREGGDDLLDKRFCPSPGEPQGSPGRKHDDGKAKAYASVLTTSSPLAPTSTSAPPERTRTLRDDTGGFRGLSPALEPFGDLSTSVISVTTVDRSTFIRPTVQSGASAMPMLITGELSRQGIPAWASAGESVRAVGLLNGEGYQRVRPVGI